MLRPRSGWTTRCSPSPVRLIRLVAPLCNSEKCLRPAHADGMLILMSDVTRILSAIEQGDPSATEQLLPLVYEELRKLRRPATRPRRSRARPSRPRPWFTKRTCGWSKASRGRHWNSRGHFFAAAAEAMRRILVENARRKKGGPSTAATGGGVDLDASRSPWTTARRPAGPRRGAEPTSPAQEPVKAELVKLRYFAGLSLEEAALCLNISPATAKRYWAVARAWLFAALSEPDVSTPE